MVELDSLTTPLELLFILLSVAGTIYAMGFLVEYLKSDDEEEEIGEFSLIDIWKDLKAGDIVLKQTEFRKFQFDKAELVVIVGVDIWDMACAVYYVDYKDFEAWSTNKDPRIQSFGEWSEFWNVLGHWRQMPTFQELLKAKRRENKFTIRNKYYK